MSTRYDAIVIGGGVVGLAAAHHLARRRQHVLVLEAQWPGSGSSGRNIGGIRRQFSTPGAIRLMLESEQQFAAMEEEFGFSVEFRRGGYLFLAHDEARLESYRRVAEMQRSMGLDVEVLDREGCRRIVPGLHPDGLLGGCFSPSDGQAYPFKVLEGYLLSLRRRGGEVRFPAVVSAIEQKGGRVTGVRLETGETLSSPVVINAAGPLAADIGRLAGMELPVQAEEHEAFITSRSEYRFAPMIVDYRPDGCYFCQRPNGQVIGCYSPDPRRPGPETSASLGFLVEMSRRLIRILPELQRCRVIRQWGGSYEMTPDGSPIIDRTPLAGFYAACGMSGHGFMFAPAVGKFIAAIVLDDRYPFDWAEFRLDRDFSAQEQMK